MRLRPEMLAAAVLVCITSSVFAIDEEEIALAKVPDAVKKAADKATPGVKWTDAARGKDEDGVYYSLEGENKQGRAVMIDVTESGEVIEIDTEIPLAEVPKTVADALKRKLPRFKATTAYVMTEEGKVGGYYFDGKRPADKEEITVFVSPDGKEIEIQKD